MPFTAHDLRYHLEISYPSLFAYLQQRAKHYLGQLAYDPNEVDVVVGHVIEQLTRMHLLGGGDDSPQSALDQLSDAQFYTFLNQSVRNKAIDRLRKGRLSISSPAELEASTDTEDENDPLDETAESLWGVPPFTVPEEEVLALVTQEEQRDLLKSSIRALSSAPRQLQAILRELEELGATELLKDLLDEFKDISIANDTQLPDYSQHKDHAHKKLRQLIQKGSDILINKIASRLVAQKPRLITDDKVQVTIPDLAQEDLSKRDVRTALRQLTTEGFLNWNDEETFYITQAQIRRLERLYKMS